MSNHYCPDCGQHHEDNHHGVRGAAVGRGASVGAPFATLRNLRTVGPSRATQAQTNEGVIGATAYGVTYDSSGVELYVARMADGTTLVARVGGVQTPRPMDMRRGSASPTLVPLDRGNATVVKALQGPSASRLRPGMAVKLTIPSGNLLVYSGWDTNAFG